MTRRNNFGESKEMYLKTIAELSFEQDIVPITNIAERLGISTVSASEMVHRLQDYELLHHTPYKGVNLTEDGQQRANSIIRCHRLWERFLVDELGISWEHVHELACRLEHATDEQITEALEKRLGNPTSCPHGNPIPTTEGKIPPPHGIPLCEMEAGQIGIIERIYPETSQLLIHLAGQGIIPGKEIEVQEIAPLNGPISLIVNKGTAMVDREAAGNILIDISFED
jgi:DtxR family Mn-dependent transcriptional regulator